MKINCNIPVCMLVDRKCCLKNRANFLDIFQAMAAVCPFVTGRSSVVCDIIKNGYNSLMIEESAVSCGKTEVILLSD